MSANLTITVNDTQLSSCISAGNSTAEKIGKTFAYCVILVFSLAGNSFIGIIVYKTKSMRKTINFLIANMAMSDLMFPIFGFPWALTEIHADSWMISGPLGQALCKLISFSTLVSIGVSIQSLVLIAVDRFGAVVFPLRSPLISSKLCPFFILATWIISIATLFPHLFAYKLVEYPDKLSCESRWNEAFGKSSSSSYYTIVLSAIELYIPCALISILYSIVLIKLKKQKPPGAQSLSAKKQRAKRQRNVLKMAIAIVIGFAICWMPLSIFTVLSTFVWDLDTTSSCDSMRYWVIAQFLAHSNCAINPCICFMFSGNYRLGLRNLLNQDI